MVGAVLEDRHPKTNGKEARKSVALVLAIYESARTGCPVVMNNGIYKEQYDQQLANLP
jgi:UDP-N-acetyl-2-amino-2-deoxyglucuronate dehydrogenase